MNKTIKILVSVLLTLCMLLPMATTVFAETSTEEPGANGTKDEWQDYYSGVTTGEYYVSTANGLLAIAAVINADTTNNFAGKTVYLTNDIVFNAGSDASTWKDNPPANPIYWTPIGNFKGTFNGEGHTVSGLYINSSDAAYSGFFGCLKDGAQVNELGVVNSYMNNTNANVNTAYMGSIAGAVCGKNVTITGCYSDAILSAGYTGGIVGVVEDTVAKADTLDHTTAALVSQCAFEGSVYACTGSAGGIVGTLDPAGTGDDHDEVQIQDCVNLGEVKAANNASNYTTGGILGLVQKGSSPTTGRATVERCLNFGSVTPSSTSSGVNRQSNSLIGQLVNSARTFITIKDCYIFKDLEQNLFAIQDSVMENPTNGSLTNTTLYINDTNTKITASTYSAGVDSCTMENSDAVKTELPNGYIEWTARTGNVNAEYPLPTSVYDNFFKVELKGVQTGTTSGTIRIIAEVDSDNYNAAGFEIIDTTDPNNQRKLDVNTTMAGGVMVYKTVNSLDGADLTATGDRLYITITITDIDANSSLTITPYTYGDAADATTKVTGESKTITFDANGILQ